MVLGDNICARRGYLRTSMIHTTQEKSINNIIIKANDLVIKIIDDINKSVTIQDFLITQTSSNTEDNVAIQNTKNIVAIIENP